MGLIGMLLAPVVLQCDLMLMAPETFALRPSLWLDCFSRAGATFGATSPPGSSTACAGSRSGLAST